MIYVAVLLILPFSWFLPWWGFVPPCFFLGLKSRSALHSLGVGFAGLFSVWLIAAYMLNIKSHGLMAKKMAVLFPLQESPWLMLLVTAVLGGVLGALWSLLGYVFYHRVWKTS